MAVRPKTLTAGAVPVCVATGLAFGEGRGRILPALAALVGALLIQIGTNFVNDYYDFIRGADGADRLGPVRVTQAGLIRPETVLRAALGVFGLAMLVGIYLVSIGGWPIVAIGLLSLACGYGYTGGPYPLGYHGLGDVLVMLFFGFIAVGGTYYVQTGMVTPTALWAGLAVGALGTALIVVNNVRDRETDVRVGKRTMAVRLGPVGSRVEYFVLLAVAFAVPFVLFARAGHSLWLLLPLVSAPLALSPARRMARQSGAALNPALGETARLQMVFGVLFALALWRGIA
jgi:1,4-dihydroxy-2-naphthoate octaprenyltransferase